jgi:hypothetical protein
MLKFLRPAFAYATAIFTAFLRHAAYSVVYFPLIAVYFTILSFSVQVIRIS